MKGVGSAEPEGHPAHQFFRRQAQAPRKQDGRGERRLALAVLKQADKDIAGPDGGRNLLLRKASPCPGFGNNFSKNSGKFFNPVH